MVSQDPWAFLAAHLCDVPALGVRLDASDIPLSDAFLAETAPLVARALREMAALEAGAKANPDEGRMVGHYWLRQPELAPSAELAGAVTAALAQVKAFARDVHAGTVAPPRAERFTDVLVVGIGGSALGPQLLADALAGAGAPLRAFFFDNTDPDGMDRVFATLDERLASTLTIVVSKSGGTVETRNGLLEAEAAYTRAGLAFGAHAVAVTSDGSALHQHAVAGGFLATFPMWDWVGGRTSVTSTVGLLPAALLGVDVDALLDGARLMDEATRGAERCGNPALLLALAWYQQGGGQGRRAMVVLPYKDRLALFGRYLQQLVMESLGKEHDLTGAQVEQGLTVYGNKGSTDQHAYVQQLRDGPNDFFVTFVDVLRDRDGASVAVAEDVTAGDYLHGFLLGTRRALADKGRASLTITLPDVSPRSLGALIALYERAVGLYAAMIGVNAYHQPGVEAGKRAAGTVVDLQRSVLAALRARIGERFTPREVADLAGEPGAAAAVLSLLDHLAASSYHPVTRQPGADPLSATYGIEA